MKKFIFIPVVILKTRTGFNAFSPVVDGCVVSDKTIDKTLERMKETLEFHFEGLQLIKQIGTNTGKVLRGSFEKYGEDAVYASLKIAA
ncbi:MAG: hypothetical protein A2583_01030 [Bdellovibrionales bacterium RIFOXYD1_FULL_53_11]|nr:MAG: hypothetical protein A2583_01030 [Bdellovibrionales bacterium RIFOXYD1_FULL_53_11]